MSRLLAPTLAVLFLAALIGCGGGGTPPSFDQDPDTTGTTATTATIPTTSGNTDGGNVDLRPAAGNYAVNLAGGSGTTTFTATGTASVASDGTATLGFPAASNSDGTVRAARFVVASSGAVSGTVTIGSAAAVPVSTATLTKPSTGGYLVTATFTDAAAAVQTYRFTLTAADPVYAGPNVGTDNRGGTYTGTGTGSLSSANVLNLTYTSTRTKSGVGVTSTHRLVVALVAGGTFSGSLDLGTQDIAPVSTRGTWSLSGNTLTLTIEYTNRNFTEVVGTALVSPIATEKLTLTKQ